MLFVHVVAHDIRSVKGLRRPNTITDNVPILVGMLLLYNRVLPKGNGVLCLNRRTPDHSFRVVFYFGGYMKDRIILLVLPALVLLGFWMGRREPVRCEITGGEVYFAPGPECEEHIIAEINKANKIDIAVYSITSVPVAKSIISAHIRGAKIRIATDRTMAGNKYSQVDELAAAGIPVRKNKGHRQQHNKFAVFDGKRIVTGSYNWTKNAKQQNAENCIFLDAFGSQYSAEFDKLWIKYQH